MYKVLRIFSGMALLSMTLTSVHAAAASGRQIQCWTDDKGNRSCGDTVPPQYAKKEREIFNSQGIVVGKKSRELTPEEAAEEKRKADEAAAELKRIQEQAAYDKFLTDTYGSTKELEAARKLREQTLDGRIMLAQKAIADNEKALVDLRGRVDSIKKSGKKEPDKKLLDQVKKFEGSLADNKNAVAQLQQEKEKMVTKFNDDIARFKVLRPGS
ncbi:MAG: hypothetical protein E6Q76_05670 [Rhizobium sp.]|nr:MAG: hypothetical protein E6Q76_05670 [Rhizobium sp.]